MMEIKKRSPHYHRLDDYELRFHLSVTEMLSKLSGPRQSSPRSAHTATLLHKETIGITYLCIWTQQAVSASS
jgi:hypothetical protein